VVKRFFPVLLICLVAAPLLLAQDSCSNNSQSANVGGAWQISWQGRDGARQATVQLQQDGSNLTGTFQDSRGSSQLTGSVSGDNVAFTVQVRGRGSLAFTGTLNGDKMTGTFQPQGGGNGGGGRGGHGGGQGNHSWTGVRQQGSSGRQSQPQQNDDDDDEVGL